MQIRLTLVALLALAFAIAFAPTQELQAASMFGPGTQLGTDGMTYAAQDKAKPKAKAKKGKAKGKRSASKAGRCGTGKYWKKGACQDAALKK